MSEGVDTVLKIANAIISVPHRLFLTTIPGRGFKCDRIDGQVVCPKCLKLGIVFPMNYDRHLEIPHKDGIPGCATDRFVCHVCFYDINTRGRVGKTLNRCNPYKIFYFSGLIRSVKLWLKKRKRKNRKENNNDARKN